jgi:two-component system response regulator YesN
MKILIVEDEKKIADGIALIIRKLSDFPCQIRIASDGKDAWESYQDSKIDLIITDIIMQKMNGLEMLDRFYEINPSIQFIIISGYDNFKYAQHAIQLSVIAYLLKPVDEEQLIAAIQKAHSSMPEIRVKEQARKLPELPFFMFPLEKESYPGSVRKLISYIGMNYMRDLSLQEISEGFMLNPNYLSGLISKHTGENFSFLLDNVRLRKRQSS